MTKHENNLPQGSASLSRAESRDSARFCVLFPHFPRLFSAPLVLLGTKVGLWGMLAVFLLVNAYTRFTMQSVWKQHLGILSHPTSFDAHLALAHDLWQKGDWTQTKNELLIAQTLSPSSLLPEETKKVLGATASPVDLLREWEEEPKRLEKEFQFWQTVVAQKPDYRDGFIQLAAISYQLGKVDGAKQYLATAQTLDPNSPAVQQLLALFAKEQ